VDVLPTSLTVVDHRKLLEQTNLEMENCSLVVLFGSTLVWREGKNGTTRPNKQISDSLPEGTLYYQPGAEDNPRSIGPPWKVI